MIVHFNLIWFRLSPKTYSTELGMYTTRESDRISVYVYEEIRWIGSEDGIRRAGKCRGNLKYSRCGMIQAIVSGGGM